jgi:hypothetical protein
VTQNGSTIQFINNSSEKIKIAAVIKKMEILSNSSRNQAKSFRLTL